MERIEDDGKISYKKIGGGSLHWNKQLIKPGQIIRLNPSEIPVNFKDVLIPLEQIKEKVEAPVKVADFVCEIVPRGKSKSLFDVVVNGKVWNEKALTKELAQNLIADLQK